MKSEMGAYHFIKKKIHFYSAQKHIMQCLCESVQIDAKLHGEVNSCAKYVQRVKKKIKHTPKQTDTNKHIILNRIENDVVKQKFNSDYLACQMRKRLLKQM